MEARFDFAGAKVMVVGGTSGINLGIAEGFAKAGARVAVASRSQEKVDAAVDLLKGHGSEAMGVAFDVRNGEDVEKGLNAVAEEFGKFDTLVSGAAGNFPALAKDMSSNAFRSVLEIDLLGTFHVMKFALPHLKTPGASVINISAPQAFIAMEFQSHVCAAKAGVDMITKTLALEWGAQGIRINSIVPGPIEGTEGMKRLAPTPEIMETVRESVPLKRNGVPEDVARTALFLASDQADYVSGQIIAVDGGWALAGVSRSQGEMMKIFGM